MRKMLMLATVAGTLWAQDIPSLLFLQRDQAAEQAEREYDRGTRALDRRQWDEAVARFNAVAEAGRSRADAALYWKAYALAKLGRNQEATAALEALARAHAQSRWMNDAKALQVEIARAAGKPISPEDASDEDIKLMAINSLMNSDPERAVPLLENLLQTATSPRLRERALFVLSQSNSQQARDVVVRAAKGQVNPDLQMKAVQMLGIHGGRRNSQVLSEIYSATGDAAVKRQVLQSFMISGDREPVLRAAKGEQSTDLRLHAIRLLGSMGGGAELAELYASESSPDVKQHILRSMIASGSKVKVIEIAKTEKDPKLRAVAVQQLGVMRSPETAEALVSIYGSATEQEVKARVLQALFVQGDARRLIEIARGETDPNLKRAAVQHLSRMKNKEATEYMLELLK